jgi:hypothetical protein
MELFHFSSRKGDKGLIDIKIIPQTGIIDMNTPRILLKRD